MLQKQKFIRVNNSNFVTKNLRKAIMKRSKLRKYNEQAAAKLSFSEFDSWDNQFRKETGILCGQLVSLLLTYHIGVFPIWGLLVVLF